MTDTPDLDAIDIHTIEGRIKAVPAFIAEVRQLRSELQRLNADSSNRIGALLIERGATLARVAELEAQLRTVTEERDAARELATAEHDTAVQLAVICEANLDRATAAEAAVRVLHGALTKLRAWDRPYGDPSYGVHAVAHAALSDPTVQAVMAQQAHGASLSHGSAGDPGEGSGFNATEEV